MLQAARDLAPLAAEHAERSERERTLSPGMAAALASSPLPSMLVPVALGGGECEPAEMLAALEELAVGDGSAAWCAMVAATSGLIAAYVDPGFAREAFGPPAVAGGVYAPIGRAVPDGDDYVLSGRWPFTSGARHATTLMGGAMVDSGEAPEARVLVFPASEATIHDNWDVMGLRGSGSHDIEVSDLRIPASRSVALGVDRPLADGPLYAFPPFGLLALGIAAVALGIARGAVDELAELAVRKKPGGSSRTLAARAPVQVAVARAEALIGSARAFVNEAVGEAWDAARSEGEITLAHRGKLRLAATHATRAAADAVDLMHEAGGGSAIYARSPLERRFRDVHTATAHMMVGPASWELSGRLRLGLETDAARL